MKLKVLDMDFAVCKIKDISQVDFSREFVFVSKTDDEISLVCEPDFAPENTLACEFDWKALKIEGILDFSLIGVISRISSILAESGVSVFVISTYNTDYILIKAKDLIKTVKSLHKNGFCVEQ